MAKLSVRVKEKTIAKLKTKKKPGSSSPIFNEALSCSVNPTLLQEVKVVVTLINEHRSARQKEVGSVILGSATFGDKLRHWNDALAAGGKHIAEWHDLN